MNHVLRKYLGGGATEADGRASALVGPTVAMPMVYGNVTDSIYICTLLSNLICIGSKTTLVSTVVWIKNKLYIASNVNFTKCPTVIRQ